MNRSMIGLICLTGVLVLPGCSWFLIGGAVAVGVLTQPDEKTQNPPVVSAENPTRLKTSPGMVQYRLFDADNEPCSISVEYSVTAGTWLPATQGLGGDGSNGLAASEAGVTHIFSWDFAADLASPEQTVQLRITASDGKAPSNASATGNFVAGNVQPVITAVDLPAGDVTGTATFTYTVSDTQSDDCRIEVQFLKSEASGDWAQAIDATPDATPSTLATQGISTAPGGEAHLFPWDSDHADDLLGEDDDVLVRIRASDNDGADWGAWFVTAATVAIRNDHPPGCIIPSVSLHQNGLVYVPYSVADTEGHDVSILAEYKIFGQSTWRRCTAGPGTTVGTFTASSEGVAGVYVWDSLKDGVYGRSVTFRITPCQADLMGLSDERNVLIGNDESDGWFSLGASPNGRSWGACASVGGKIYYLGGYTSWPTPVTDVHAYDPAADTWSVCAAMPGAGYGLQAVTLDGRIHAVAVNNQNHYAYDPTTDTWTVEASLPDSRKYPGVAVTRGRIYVTGGKNNLDATVGDVFVYDPATATWSTGPAMPIHRLEHQSVGVDGRVYVSGGRNGPGTEPDVIWLDVGTGIWSTAANAPHPRQNGAMVVHDGRIIELGGGWETGTTSTALRPEVDAYDPVSDTWSSLATMLHDMRRCSASLWGGKIYAVGGGQLEVFDPWRRGWVTRTDMTRIREGQAGAVAGDSFYLAGGIEDLGYLSVFERYDVESDAYTARAAVSVARSFGGGAYLNGLFYLVGGETAAQTETDRVDVYIARFNIWNTRASLPSPRARLGCVACGGRLYAVGGRYYSGSADVWLADVDRFDPSADTWESVAPLPGPLAAMGCAVFGGKIYVAGGENGSSSAVSDVWRYDPAANTWNACASLPQTLVDARLSAHRGGLLCLGGKKGGQYASDEVYRYDPVADSWSATAVMPWKRSAGYAGSWENRVFWFGGWETYDMIPGWWQDEVGMFMEAKDRIAAPIRDLPQAVSGAAAFVISGHLHVMGGRDVSDQIVATHQVKSISQDVLGGQPFDTDPVWTTGATPSQSREGASAVVAGGLAYVAGGFGMTGQPLSLFERYDPASDTWEALADMPTARGFMGMVKVGERLFVVGGKTDSGVTGAVSAYNLVTETWETGFDPLTTSRSHLSVAELEGRIVAAGGEDASGTPLSDVEVYDLAKDAWASQAALPIPLSGAACMVESQAVRLFGGATTATTGTLLVSRVFLLDPAAGTWTEDRAAALSFAARDMAAAVGAHTATHRSGSETREWAFLIGGMGRTEPMNKVFRFYTR